MRLLDETLTRSAVSLSRRRPILTPLGHLGPTEPSGSLGLVSFGNVISSDSAALTLGQVLPSVIVEDEATLFTEVGISGNASSMRAFFTADMSPQPTGLFSNDTQIMTAPVAPCEE